MNHLVDCCHHGWVFHQVEAEQFLAQILERTAEGVQLGVINQQEAVVDVGDLVEFHGRVLAVVPGHIQPKGFRNLAHADGCALTPSARFVNWVSTLSSA